MICSLIMLLSRLILNCGSKNLSRAARFITRKMLRTHASEVEASLARI